MGINNIETAVLPKDKVVSEAPIARKLLKDGYKITDIKPKKGSPRESVFIFEVVPGFIEKMECYVKEKNDLFKEKTWQKKQKEK